MTASPALSQKPLINDNPELQSYYATLESRIGYRLFLNGARHFGYYNPGTIWPFPIGPAVRRMEDYLFNALKLEPGALVLDAGCGVGLVAIHLARKGLRICGIDVVDRHIRWAQRNVKKAGLEDAISVNKVDYHHLEPFAPETFDGVYTMETFVHATDPAEVFRQFFRVLKPGGRICLHEYDHLGYEGTPEKLVKSLDTINKYAAMPTHTISKRGVLKSMMEEAGFEDVEVADITENVRPMLRLFYFCAVIPYLFIRFLGLEKHFINAVAAVETYRNVEFYRYISITGRKPLAGGADVNGERKSEA